MSTFVEWVWYLVLFIENLLYTISNGIYKVLLYMRALSFIKSPLLPVPENINLI